MVFLFGWLDGEPMGSCSGRVFFFLFFPCFFSPEVMKESLETTKKGHNHHTNLGYIPHHHPAKSLSRRLCLSFRWHVNVYFSFYLRRRKRGSIVVCFILIFFSFSHLSFSSLFPLSVSRFSPFDVNNCLPSLKRRASEKGLGKGRSGCQWCVWCMADCGEER